MTHPHVKDMLASLHTKSWFKVGQSDRFLVVSKGGRQGCRFGGVIFNMSYTRASRQFQKEIEEAGIATKIRIHSSHVFSTTVVDDGDEVIILDVTFVDDEAIAIVASVPTTMASKLIKAIQLLVECFSYYGMTINWAAGKTEVMINYRGKGAKAQKLRLVQEDGSRKFKIDIKASPENGIQEDQSIEIIVVQ